MKSSQTPDPSSANSLTRRGTIASPVLTRRALVAGALGGAALACMAGLRKAGAETRPASKPGNDRGPLGSTVVEVGEWPLHTAVAADAAPAGALPLVLVHGLALSHRYMVPTAERLMADFPVYAPDLPGFGDSAKPARTLDVPGLADALAAWMHAAGLERAMFLGNSFGCQIIADFAARYPERVERAVLQGPTTPPDERSWIQQFIRWQQNSPHNPPEMGDIAGADYRKCGLVRALVTFEYSLRDRMEDKLPHIRAPMLVVRGALDPICRPEWAQQVADLLPQGQLMTLPDVAHTLVFTAPDALADASRPFLLAATETR